MKFYNTTAGILLEEGGKFYLVSQSWDQFVNDENLYQKARDFVAKSLPVEDADALIENELLPPIGSQEVWASGVTYERSRDARMEESKDAGGGDFYDRVYASERPELFFKATPHRTVGSGQAVRIRRDSAWNVPEPELTLYMCSTGRVIGYTVGNDMSSRDIEGENPLYLAQAKTYDKSAAIGPCLLVTEDPLPADTRITLEINRNGVNVFTGETSLARFTRKFDDMAGYLFRECTFPSGCYLMTGTGVVPEDEFTLQQADEIRITIEHIGTLVNFVE